MAQRETTVAATVVADMLQYLSDRGVGRTGVMADAGIRADFAATPQGRVPGSQVERLWDLAVERSGDPLVGLHMGESYNPGALDILGYVILSAPTLGDVLERVTRYMPLLNDGMRMELIRDGGVAYCACSYRGGVDNYLLRSPRQALDATWAGLAREMRRLPVVPVRAQAIWFRHSGPGPDGASYQRALEAPVRFDAPEDRFILRPEDLDQPIRSANPALLELFDRHARGALTALQRTDAASNQVIAVLLEKLKGTAPPLGDVARHLAMSSRNLQRQLREAGTSYQALLDEVRRDVAIRYLADPSASVGQIGYLLGFSEPSAFHRAFRRWTGRSPGTYRQQI